MKMETIIITVVLAGLGMGAVGTAFLTSGSFSIFADSEVTQQGKFNCDWKLIKVNGFTFDSEQDWRDYAESQDTNNTNLDNVQYKTIEGELHGRIRTCS
jgi:hypothetical protein